MDRDGYRANAGDRCYFCKAELLDILGPLAERHGYAHVATGTNADDAVAGFRPGIRAAHERGAVTPLRDAGLTKEQIRAASAAWGLPTWDKPAAACLSSRVAYGIEVSPFRLARVERAEVAVRGALESAGVRVRDLRVRDLGDLASIELDGEALAAAPGLPAVTEAALAAGFPEARGRPEGLPVRLDERAAARSRAISITRSKARPARPILDPLEQRRTKKRSHRCLLARSSGTTPRRASASCPRTTAATSTSGPTALPAGVASLKAGHPGRVRHRPGAQGRPGAPGARARARPVGVQGAAQEARRHGQHHRGPLPAAREHRETATATAGTPTRRPPSRRRCCCARSPTSSSCSPGSDGPGGPRAVAGHPAAPGDQDRRRRRRARAAGRAASRCR